jgi:SH3 domain-containing protein
MSFTRDQYSQIAGGYDKASKDPLVSAEKRAEFAKKAEWFNFLAGRASETHWSSGSLRENERVRFNPEPAGHVRRMAPFLATLWMIGAVVYLGGTVLLTNAVNLFGPENRGTLVRETKRSITPLPKVTSVEGSATASQTNLQNVAGAQRRHAISPDQPYYEDPALTLPSTPSTEEGPKALASEPNVDVAGDEMFRVTAAATIRNGPSVSARKIGTATAGAELKVKAREKDWVQFVDPSSGNSGWIQASLVEPASHREEALPLPSPTEASPVNPAKPKLARKKPSGPAKVARRPATYAGLPPDEEFVPRKRRGGPLSRRRVLREGLMSPGFFPPD